MGRLLYDAPDRKERDYLQAVAWFQLAGEQGLTEADQMAAGEAPKLNAQQTAWIANLKRQLVRK